MSSSPHLSSTPARWSLSISPETDASLREFLGAQGLKKGDLSRFVEDAVRWRMLDTTAKNIQERNADKSDGELQRLIDAALDAVRHS